MLFQTLNQVEIFAFLLFAGIMIGFLYEAMRVVCNVVYGKALVFFRFSLEFLFMCISILAYILAVNFACYGQIRFFTVLACFFGFFLERISFGVIVQRFFGFIGQVFKKVYKKIKKWYSKIADKHKKLTIKRKNSAAERKNRHSEMHKKLLEERRNRRKLKKSAKLAEKEKKKRQKNDALQKRQQNKNKRQKVRKRI